MIVKDINMKFLVVASPSYIYHFGYTSPGGWTRTCTLFLSQLNTKISPLYHRWRTVHIMANLERLLKLFRSFPIKRPVRISHPGIIPSVPSPSGCSGLLSPTCDPFYVSPPPWVWSAVFVSDAWVRCYASATASSPYPGYSYSNCNYSSSFSLDLILSSYPYSLPLSSSLYTSYFLLSLLSSPTASPPACKAFYTAFGNYYLLYSYRLACIYPSMTDPNPEQRSILPQSSVTLV